MMRLVSLILVCFFVVEMPDAAAYWQQRTDISIKVTLDDQRHVLYGFESLKYVNHSPDTLHSLMIHLWPNAYKNDQTAFCEEMVSRGKTDFYYAKESDRGFIDSLKFKSEGQSLEYKLYEESEDIIQLELHRPLLPGDSMVIETPFRVKIPKQFSRLGHSGNAYFISQWFPKPAVYDVRGWHPLHYQDQGEFFSEYGSYDVAVTLAANYVILGTGTITDASENKWLDSLSKIPARSDSFYRNLHPVSSPVMKTVHFSEQRIHDFAWFADKRWVVSKSSYDGPAADRPVEIITACLPEHRKQWRSANEMARFALEQYGTRVGRYPYQSLKVVEGDLLAGGGMEYPTIALVDQSAVTSLSQVIFHEVGHNWFYGVLGSDERTFPWLDEGLNSYYERLTSRLWDQQRHRIPKTALEDIIPFYQQSVGDDQPSDLPAGAYTSVNYGGDIYVKVPLLLEGITQCVGQTRVDSLVRSYYTQYQFRHPSPENFQTIFATHIIDGLPPHWFAGALASDQPVRLRLSSVHRSGTRLKVRLRNQSALDLPVQLRFVDSNLCNARVLPLRAHADTTLLLDSITKWHYAEIADAGSDFALRDNRVYNRLLFRRKGIAIGPGFGLQRSYAYRLFAAPYPSFNIYDGPSIGVALHNFSFPLSRFQFLLAPSFGIRSKMLHGIGGIAYSWYPRHSALKEIRFQTDLKSFSMGKSDLNIADPLYIRYFKQAASLELVFRNADARSPIQRSILLRQYRVAEQGFGYGLNSSDSLYRPFIKAATNYYWVLQYSFQNRQTFHPYSWSARAEAGSSYVKFGIEGRKRVDYDVPHKALYLRAYAGKFINLNRQPASSRYWLNSTYTGVNDYLYDALFVGRLANSGFSGAQLYEQEGGAKTPTNQYINPLGRSGNWLLALNVKTDLPLGRIPLRVYLDVQTMADAKRLNPSGNTVSFQSGLELHLAGELIHVYLPLLLSADYRDYLNTLYPKGRLLRSITFSVQLRNLNWMRTHERLFGLLVQ